MVYLWTPPVVQAQWPKPGKQWSRRSDLVRMSPLWSKDLVRSWPLWRHQCRRWPHRTGCEVWRDSHILCWSGNDLASDQTLHYTWHSSKHVHVEVHFFKDEITYKALYISLTLDITQSGQRKFQEVESDILFGYSRRNQKIGLSCFRKIIKEADLFACSK